MNNSTLIAIDIAKSVFHVVMLTRHGKETKRKKLSRNQLVKFIAKTPAQKIVMEACGSSNHWGRKFKALGREVELLPPQHVKAYARGQKNDYNDALAIGEASLHGRIRPVGVKTLDQQDDSMLFKLRKQLVREMGDCARQIRSFLSEYGLVFGQGITKVREEVPLFLADAENGLSDFSRALIARHYAHFSYLEKECAWYTEQLKSRTEADEDCQRIKTVPGFGEINTALFKNWLGNGAQFKRGRDASAALGVVPRQHTSGDKPLLMGITKRGDKDLRSLIVHGARAVVSRASTKDDRLSRWINDLIARRGFNKAVIAYANKMVRMAWAVVRKQESYQSHEHLFEKGSRQLSHV